MKRTFALFNALLKPLGLKVRKVLDSENSQRSYAIIVDLDGRGVMKNFKSLAQATQFHNSYGLERIEMLLKEGATSFRTPGTKTVIANPYLGCKSLEEMVIVRDLISHD